MTERQRRFAEFYAANPNATAAAKAAGFSQQTAYSQGQRLLKNVEVMKYIRELQDNDARGRLVSVLRVKAFLSGVILDEKEKTTDRLKAADMFLRAAGEYLHFRPDPEAEWRQIIGEQDGSDVVIYLPPIEKEEDALIPFEFDE